MCMVLWWNNMDDVQKKRILDLYGCSDSVSSYLIRSGTKVGHTTKSKLEHGSIEELDEKN